MKKKLMYAILLIVFFSIVFYIRHYQNVQEYNEKYSININKGDIQKDLKNWLNRDPGDDLNPIVFELDQLDHSSTYMVLFEFGEDGIGSAQLVKGRNNKLRIKEASYGGIFDYTFRDIQTNKGSYSLVIGRNPNLAVDHIVVKVDDTKEFSYPIDVSKDKFFYHYMKIPDQLVQRPKIIYYDKNNKELSNDELRFIFAAQ